MPSAIIPKDKEISEEIILLRRMVQMMSQQSAVDTANRQRITLDMIGQTGLTTSIPVSGTIAAVTSVTNVAAVTSVTNVAAVTSVTNVAAMAGEGQRMFEVPARNMYANAIRNKLTFA